MSTQPAPGTLVGKWQSALDIVRGMRKVCILTHDNPDPDSIAGSFALEYFLRELAGIDTVIVYGGMLWRAENRAMVRILKIDMRPSSKISFSNFKVIALIDTQPGAGNNSLPPSMIPSIVIDHHGPLRRKTQKAAFYDVRRDHGSVSSILTEYLIAAGVKIPPRVATALLYGIRTDTQDLTRKVHRADVEAYRHLLGLANLKRLARMKAQKRPLSFFHCFHEALESARTYGPVIVAPMNSVANPDLLAVAADNFIRAEGIKWAVVFAPYEDAIYISVRCSGSRQNAAGFVRKTVARKGSSGGHMSMAGGKIPLPSKDPAAVAQLMDQYLARVLDYLKRDPTRFRRLLDTQPVNGACKGGGQAPKEGVESSGGGA